LLYIGDLNTKTWWPHLDALPNYKEQKPFQSTLQTLEINLINSYPNPNNVQNTQFMYTRSSDSKGFRFIKINK